MLFISLLSVSYLISISWILSVYGTAPPPPPAFICYSETSLFKDFCPTESPLLQTFWPYHLLLVYLVMKPPTPSCVPNSIDKGYIILQINLIIPRWNINHAWLTMVSHDHTILVNFAVTMLWPWPTKGLWIGTLVQPWLNLWLTMVNHGYQPWSTIGLWNDTTVQPWLKHAFFAVLSVLSQFCIVSMKQVYPLFHIPYTRFGRTCKSETSLKSIMCTWIQIPRVSELRYPCVVYNFGSPKYV